MKKFLTSMLICCLMTFGFSVMSSNSTAQEKAPKTLPQKTVKKDSGKSDEKPGAKRNKGARKAGKGEKKIDFSKLPKVEVGEFLAAEKSAGSVSVPVDVKSKQSRPRLPMFYRNLELTEEQLLKIYAIQKEYFETSSNLRFRLERLDDEREALCEKVLTAEQKTKLEKAEANRPKPGSIHKSERGPNREKPFQTPGAAQKEK